MACTIADVDDMSGAARGVWDHGIGGCRCSFVRCFDLTKDQVSIKVDWLSRIEVRWVNPSRVRIWQASCSLIQTSYVKL
jgi:hypothetical protein